MNAKENPIGCIIHCLWPIILWFIVLGIGCLIFD